jgi:peptidoglycan biosynthesis protein MviN/MurJ (putative lipid II flippase)
MWRHIRGLETRRLFAGLGKICVAGVLLALVCWAANYWWLDTWEQLRFFKKLCALVAGIVVSLITFFGAAFLLRVDEVQDVVDLVRQRFRP